LTDSDLSFHRLDEGVVFLVPFCPFKIYLRWGCGRLLIGVICSLVKVCVVAEVRREKLAGRINNQRPICRDEKVMKRFSRLIAVVDDDEAVRESLLDLLEVSGYSAVTFASAAEFLLSPQIPDMSCLVLDISLPGMSGIDLSKELRRRNIAIPVVFMTGHAQQSLIDEAKRTGACLFKPFVGAELRSAIESAVAV